MLPYIVYVRMSDLKCHPNNLPNLEAPISANSVKLKDSKWVRWEVIAILSQTVADSTNIAITNK